MFQKKRRKHLSRNKSRSDYTRKSRHHRKNTRSGSRGGIRL